MNYKELFVTKTIKSIISELSDKPNNSFKNFTRKESSLFYK